MTFKTVAKRAGYTALVVVELGDRDYYGWVKPAAVTGTVPFTFIDDETGTIRNFPEADAVRALDY